MGISEHSIITFKKDHLTLNSQDFSLVQSILSNLAIILLTHLVMSTLMNYKDRLRPHLVSVCIV